MRFTSLAGLAAALIVAPGCVSGSSSGSGGTASSAAPKRLPVPASLTARATPFKVKLHWVAAQGGGFDGYVITRNGASVARVPSTRTGYSDDTVSPKHRYVYAVTTARRFRTSAPVTTRVKTPMPRLAAARLIGYFNVHPRVTSQYGYTRLGVAPSGWHFTPTCRTGPCNAIWSDNQSGKIHARALRHGGSYHTRFHGVLFANCGSAHETSSLDFTIHITKARVSDGEWIATRFKGTLTRGEAEQLGCVASQAVETITGRLTVAG
jgi:hypothetical protein